MFPILEGDSFAGSEHILSTQMKDRNNNNTTRKRPETENVTKTVRNYFRSSTTNNKSQHGKKTNSNWHSKGKNTFFSDCMKTISFKHNDEDQGRGGRQVWAFGRQSAQTFTCVDCLHQKQQQFLLLLRIICKQLQEQAWWLSPAPSAPGNKSTTKPTEQPRKQVAGFVFPGFDQIWSRADLAQTTLSCRSGSKSSWLLAGGVSSSLPGSGVLMCTPASAGMDSLPSAWDFSPRDNWEEEEEQEVFSGMKRAKRKATTTVHAPRRKGGPGMRPRCRADRNTPSFHPSVFHCISNHETIVCAATSVGVCRGSGWRLKSPWMGSTAFSSMLNRKKTNP